MADGMESVAEFRRFADRFRLLISHNTPYRFTHLMGLICDGDLIFDRAWKGGFLRSIDRLEHFAKLSELLCKEIGATLHYDLFGAVIGFNVEPNAMRKGSIESGLLVQAPIDFKPIPHPFDSMDQMLMAFKGGIEDLKPIASYIADDSKWADTMDRVSFDLCDRYARGCEMVAEIIQSEMASDNAPQQALQIESDRVGKAPKLTVNEKMIVLIQKNPEAQNYSASQWANALDVAKSTIHGTKTWKNLMDVRRSEGASRQSRQSNASSDKPNAPGKSKKIRPEELL